MSVIDSYLKSQPLSTWKFTVGTGAPVDLSGRSRTLTRVGTQAAAPHLTTAASDSQLCKSNGNYFTTVVPEFGVNGKEYQQYSLATWFKPSTFNGNIALLAHYSTVITDGLYFNGDKIVFEIDFTTAGTVQALWDVPDFSEAYYAVGVYTGSSARLMVNGDVVAETELSDAQKADTFLNASSTYYVGIGNPATQAAIIDLPAIYNRALSGPEALAHYNAGRERVSAVGTAGYFGATHYDGTDASRSISQTKTWTEDDDFLAESPFNVVVENGYLKPVVTGTTSESGDWIASFPVDAPATSISGVKAEWDGSGTYTVEASLDAGTTWAAITNGNIINGTNPYTPTTPLMIRVTFAGGVANDPASVSDLRLTAYNDNVVSGSNVSRNTTITGNVTTATENNEPIEYNDAAGFGFKGGYLTLDPDAQETPILTYGISTWLTWDNLTAATEYVFRLTASSYVSISSSGVLSKTGTDFALYVNGVPVTTYQLTPGAPVWVFAKIAAGSNVSTLVGATAAGANPFRGKMNALDLMLFAAPSDTQILSMYNTYYGTTVGTVTDANVMTIAEDSNPPKYSADSWSISSSA